MKNALSWLFVTCALMGFPALATPQERIAEADQLSAEKKIRDALAIYLEVLAESPGSVEANFKAGTAYAALGYYPQAVDKWSSARDLTSDPAVRESVQKNVDRAVAKMARMDVGQPARAVDRELARMAYDEGLKRLAKKDFLSALEFLTTSLNQDSTLAEPFVARGTALIGLRRYPEAVADYQHALALNPQMAAPRYGLGEAYRAMGRTSEAKENYQKYLDSSGKDVRPDLFAEVNGKLLAL